MGGPGARAGVSLLEKWSIAARSALGRADPPWGRGTCGPLIPRAVERGRVFALPRVRQDTSVRAHKESAMEVRFWGVRGSVAVSGSHVAKTGGNTSCIEVTSQGERLILDAGTGLR